jgi:regulatory protein
MLRKLALRGASEEDAEGVVEKLATEGWLDDRRFAERFAEAAVASGRFFGPRLRLEMRRRGIPAELAGEVLERLNEGHDEQDDLRSLLERRFPSFRFSAAAERERRRVVNFLQRRGFGVSVIMQTLRAEDTEQISYIDSYMKPERNE